MSLFRRFYRRSLAIGGTVWPFDWSGFDQTRTQNGCSLNLSKAAESKQNKQELSGTATLLLKLMFRMFYQLNCWTKHYLTQSRHFFIWALPDHFSLSYNFQQWKDAIGTYKNCWCLDSNQGPLVLEVTALPQLHTFCGQSYKHFTIVIYESRVVPDLKVPHITTLDS